MDSWAPTDAALTTLGFDPTGVRSATLQGGDPTGVRSMTGGLGGDPTGVRSPSAVATAFAGDPTGVRGWEYGFGGHDPLMEMGLPAMQAEIKPETNPWMPNAGMTTGSTVGQVGGDWSGVEQWSSAINTYAAQYGVDPNVIKAIMKLESNGDPQAGGAPGVWGPMQVNANAWGQGPWMSDPVANIKKGIEIFKSYLDGAGGNVREALRGYHGYGSDGYTTDQQYADIVLGNLSALQNLGGGGMGSAGMGYNPSAGSGNLTSLFGNYGSSVPDWGGFGVESGNGLYDYGTQYGMNGHQHTGLDVPMPVGTAYRAPMGGVVTCAGTGVGNGTNGQGCAAFQDTIGGGAGRVEVLLDNGITLIYGHSSGSALRPGQRFNAGTVLGWSGGMNSPHVHLEARVPDSSMPSGYRIVDPRTVLGGGSYGGYSAAQPNQQQAGGADWGSIITNFLTIPGYHW